MNSGTFSKLTATALLTLFLIGHPCIRAVSGQGYEVLYLSELEDALGTNEFLELGGPVEIRDDFRCFVQSRLEGKRAGGAGEDERYLDRIMKAYDRIHGIFRSEFEYVDASHFDLSERLLVSFDSTDHAKRGGAGKK